MSKKAIMWLGCGAMVLAGAYFLWSRGFGNILGYAMLLICPLSHLLLMRGHGHNHQHGAAGGKDDKPTCH